MASRRGDLRKLAEQGHRDRVAPLGQGSGGGPQAGGRGSGSARRPRRCCSAAGGAGTYPSAGRRARRTGSLRSGSGVLAGRWGAGLGRARSAEPPRLGRPRCAAPRRSHTSAAQPRASGPGPRARPPHLGNRRPPGIPPTPGGKKVTWGRPGGRARRGVGTRLGLASCSAVRRRLGRGEEAAAQGCSPRLPPPPFAGDSAELRRGPRPDTVRRKPTSPRLPSRRGGGGRRSTSGQLAWNSRLVLAQGQAPGTTPRDGCQER